MKLLIVSPDYASHATPLIEIGRAWALDHGEVVVATGAAVRPLVDEAMLGWIELRLGAGSNPGVIEVARQPAGEDAHLQAFFDATRGGPVATLRYQADARRRDLMYDPDGVLDRLAEIIAEVRPDRVVVDHVAFGARAALHALGVAAASVVLGHPSSLPSLGEVYGLPDAWPPGVEPAADDLDDLRRRCELAVDDLCTAADDLITRRAPGRPLIGDITRQGGLPTIYAYPRALHPSTRTLPSTAVFVGSLAKAQALDGFQLPIGTGPRVTVALGSFLSARGDVLSTAVRAAHLGGWRLTMAHGSTPLDQLGRLPDGAAAARHIPQVAVLTHTDVVVHHGGNGSVTESVAAGVPMVVLPFSTDQFAAAAAVERAGVGAIAAPNELAAEQLAALVQSMIDVRVRQRMQALAVECAADGGAAAAAAAVAASR